ncbi:hypothetical protein [Streptomyces sp. NBRC 110028]|uniref:hypothetical protein n=1 Tax=Streptomyces sp. NBRC 110028 TaxID=1621260 RepID=UPI000A4ED628|nr:hypothetical protein [Streptomyces sp. NBRC 110028]
MPRAARDRAEGARAALVGAGLALVGEPRYGEWSRGLGPGRVVIRGSTAPVC